MSSAKTERLVNLTMALLGSRRFLTKSEIFRRVAGYTGSIETKERMFERDKDDLRSLGIEIEVSSHDPLFEDEVGYRIRSDLYKMADQIFDSRELGIITLALNSLQDGMFSDTSKSLLLRINSLLVSPVAPDEIRTLPSSINETGLVELVSALAKRTPIEFGYLKLGSDIAEIRRINPLGLSAWRNNWYLVGEDISKGEIRVFKVDRISNLPKAIGKPESFSIPEDFSVRDYVIMFNSEEFPATVKVRVGSGMNLRNRAKSINRIDEEWDQISINFKDIDEACREILWLGEDAVALDPEPLQTRVIAALQMTVKIHG